MTMIGKLKHALGCLSLLSGVFFTCGVHAKTDEEQVGEAAAGRILGAAGLIQSASAQRYLNMVGNSLVQRANVNYRWHFGLIKSDSINAFAAPGGFILVTTGLVKTLQSEDELAFVLAHEITHVLRRHHYRVVQRQRLAESAAKQIQAGSDEAAFAALSQASAQIYARGLDKTAEFESDRLGAELMTQAGFDPAAAIGVLEQLQRVKGDDPRAELLFSTHPSAADRLDTLLQTGVDTLPRPTQQAMQQRSARFRKFLSLF